MNVRILSCVMFCSFAFGCFHKSFHHVVLLIMTLLFSAIDSIKATLPVSELVRAICNILWGNPDDVVSAHFTDDKRC